MKIQLDDHMNYLKDSMKAIVEKVLNSVKNSKTALINMDVNLAETVIQGDEDINQNEIEIDKICIQILALQNPIAHDLRFLFSTIKINHYFERIGDFSALISKEVIFLNKLPKDHCKKDLDIILEKINHVFDMVENMIMESAESFLYQNNKIVNKIIEDDLKVDKFYEEIFNFIIEILQDKKMEVKVGFSIINIIKGLERMGDYTKNICEQTIYLKEGKIIRYDSSKKN